MLACGLSGLALVQVRVFSLFFLPLFFLSDMAFNRYFKRLVHSSLLCPSKSMCVSYSLKTRGGALTAAPCSLQLLPESPVWLISHANGRGAAGCL